MLMLINKVNVRIKLMLNIHVTKHTFTIVMATFEYENFYFF